MVQRRRDAGDASMDVELARVDAGQQANIEVGDSLTVRLAYCCSISRLCSE